MNQQYPGENAAVELVGAPLSQERQTDAMRAAGSRQALENPLEIDFVELAFLLLEQLHYIVFFALLGALVCNCYAYFFVPPTYQSTASLYMVSASSGQLVNLSDLNLGSSMTGDYQELILSYPVLDLVSEKLNLGLSTGAMRGMISISNPAGTRILKLTATAGTPELARDVANTVAEVSAEYLPETMNTVPPNIAQRARLNTAKTGPNINRFTLLGGMLGAAACCGWFVLLYILDDTIHSSDDMEKYFGFAPLATVPFADEMGDNRTKGGGKGRGGKNR